LPCDATNAWGTAYLDALAGRPAPSPSATPTPTPRPSVAPSPTPPPPPTPTPTATPIAGADPVIAAAGDIACDPTRTAGAPANCDQAATAQQVVNLNPDAVLALGDNQYESNTANQYASVYNTTWGRFKAKIKPAIGNHEYLTAGATGYFGYFGAAAGDPAKGYYSYDLGAWHLISLNSECSHVGGCASGNPQEAWLRADLAAHPNACTLAYWHEPRFSNGQHGNATQMTTIWNDLVAGHADIVLSGHNHDYERYAPMDGSGARSATGVAEWVVGTGGKNHYAISAAPLAGEIVSNDKTFGILKLVLHPTSYDWQFLPAPGYSFTDSRLGGLPMTVEGIDNSYYNTGETVIPRRDPSSSSSSAGRRTTSTPTAASPSTSPSPRAPAGCRGHTTSGRTATSRARSTPSSPPPRA
jgi:hypothetical protein